MTLLDTSNGFLVHFQRNADKKFLLSQYTFGGALKQTIDLSPSFGATAVIKPIYPFSYSQNGGIYFTDPVTTNTVHIFNSNTLTYIKDLKNIFSVFFDIRLRDGAVEYMGYDPSGNMIGYSNGVTTVYSGYVSPSINYPFVSSDGNDMFNFYADATNKTIAVYKNGIQFTVYNNIPLNTINLSFSKNINGSEYIALSTKVNGTGWTFLAKFGSFPTIWDIEVNSHGIFVTDGNGNIQAFDLSYNPLWSTPSTGFAFPCITSDSQYIYLLDFNNVDKYDFSGTLISSFNATNGYPTYALVGIFVDSTYIYICDQDANVIRKYTTGGAFVSQFNCGIWNGHNVKPFDVYVYNNLYYVSAGIGITGDYGIFVYDMSGVLQFKFGLYGSENGKLGAGFNFINFYNNQLFVGDSYNGRVEIFDPLGNYVSKFMTAGTGDGQGKPQGVFGYNGKIYITDYQSNRVQVFTSSVDSTTISIYSWIGNSLSLIYNEAFNSQYIVSASDIDLDYYGNMYIAVNVYDTVALTTTLQVWKITGTASHSVVLNNIDSFSGQSSDLRTLSLTSYYTETNVGSAISNGVYMTSELQNGIPSYKLKNYNAMVK